MAQTIQGLNAYLDSTLHALREEERTWVMASSVSVQMSGRTLLSTTELMQIQQANSRAMLDTAT